jgi:hypothetical protein
VTSTLVRLRQHKAAEDVCRIYCTVLSNNQRLFKGSQLLIVLQCRVLGCHHAAFENVIGCAQR